MIFFVYILATDFTADFSLRRLCSARDSVHSMNPCNPPTSAVAVAIYLCTTEIRRGLPNLDNCASLHLQSVGC